MGTDNYKTMMNSKTLEFWIYWENSQKDYVTHGQCKSKLKNEKKTMQELRTDIFKG